MTGERFTELLENYLRGMLRKGVPSLFNDIKLLYKDESKKREIERTVLKFYKTLRETSKFSENETEVEPPSALLWVMHFLGQHYDQEGDSGLALKYINEALDHTPTAVELLMVKARIYKVL